MNHKCPYCGNVIKLGVYCNACLHRIDSFKKIWDMSAFYYNQGLKASHSRELSLACNYLQKAITLYKYNVEARNLLGLVYFEMGQTGSALKEWIISSSYEKEENNATYYIEAIQKQPKFLENHKEAIVLYNKSLFYMQQKNIDMAIIRLKKAVSLNPKLLEARALLALAYMKQNQFHKASEQVNKVLVIDKSHPMSLAYFRELSKEKIEELQPYERDYSKQNKTQTSVIKMLDRSMYHRRYIGYFVLGAISMIIISKFLVLPSKMNDYKNQIATLQEAKEVLSEQVQNLSQEQTIKITDLESQNKKLKEKVTLYEQELSVFKQKEKLTRAQELITNREYEEAAQMIYNVATTCLEETDLEVLEKLKETAYLGAIERLYSQGTSLYNAENYIEATMQFETLLQYEPQERIARKSLYYLGQINEKNNDIDGAKKYYNKIVAQYPDTSEAYKATERLEELSIS